MIHFNNVSFVRNKKNILTEVDWHVKEGEDWVILGLNGAGKTSLLNIVNGYFFPTKGSVSVLGETFGKTDIFNLRKQIGWVSSALQAKLNESHLVKDIVVSGLNKSFGFNYKEPTKEEYVLAKDALCKLNSEELFEKRYELCSHGEKQKVLIARGLMGHPKLLILDEATSGLDFLAREKLLEDIQKLKDTQTAPLIIYVTHHLEEIIDLFTHVLLLKEGHVLAQGKKEVVLTEANLKKLFERDVKLSFESNRPWLRL